MQEDPFAKRNEKCIQTDFDDDGPVELKRDIGTSMIKSLEMPLK